MILALVALYHLMVWAIPIMAGVGFAWLALENGSGWLIAIGAGFIGACLAFAILYAGMASRSLRVRYGVLALFTAPPVWAGAVAARSLAIEAGAQGPVWPVVAALTGGLVFGVLAATRLAALAVAARPAPSARPAVEPRPADAAEPEPKVIYYQPIHPPKLRLRDGRGDADRIIDA